MATAIPPSDIMLAVRFCSDMGINDNRIATGNVRMAISAERKCSRNTMMMSETTIISSVRVCFNVSMAWLISSERS